MPHILSYIMEIIKKNKEEYIEELIKYGDPPSLEELQCLNLLIDTLQPTLIESFKKTVIKINKFNESTQWQADDYIKKLSDSELRQYTIRDIGAVLQEINKLGIKIPSIFWLKIYLPRYKKFKRKYIPEAKRLAFIDKLLKETRKEIKLLPPKSACSTCPFWSSKYKFCRRNICIYNKL